MKFILTEEFSGRIFRFPIHFRVTMAIGILISLCYIPPIINKVIEKEYLVGIGGALVALFLIIQFNYYLTYKIWMTVDEIVYSGWLFNKYKICWKNIEDVNTDIPNKIVVTPKTGKEIKVTSPPEFSEAIFFVWEANKKIFNTS